VAIRRADFPLPDVDDPLTAPFFEGAAAGELRIPRCDACATWVWYPEERCHSCGGGEMTWQPTSGLGRLFSWAVVRRAFLPAFDDLVPFVTGLVALDDAPQVRIVTRVVDCDPEALAADEPVEVVFRAIAFPTVPAASVVVPLFRPVGTRR
jgi:uncharacterized OB-fold protein